MAIINVNPIILKDVVATIGTDSYQKHLEQVQFTPSASPVTWTGLGNNTWVDVPKASWKCELTYAQDWETTNSLSRYLFDNEGDTVEMTFRPKSGSGPSFTADVVITPGAIGGNVNSVATASVTLPVIDKPVLVPAA